MEKELQVGKKESESLERELGRADRGLGADYRLVGCDALVGGVTIFESGWGVYWRLSRR
jgi:hypothetical protein